MPVNHVYLEALRLACNNLVIDLDPLGTEMMPRAQARPPDSAGEYAGQSTVTALDPTVNSSVILVKQLDAVGQKALDIPYS